MSNTDFNWQCQPEAERFLLEILDRCIKLNPMIEQLQNQLLNQTSTRLFDWLDHLVIADTEINVALLQSLGFVRHENMNPTPVYFHPGAQFPQLVLKSAPLGIAVAVESIADFLLAKGGESTVIEGTPLSPYRRCLISSHPEASLWVVERRDLSVIEPTWEEPSLTQIYLHAREKWQSRQRNCLDQDQAMQEALTLAQELVPMVGQTQAAWIVLEGERKYWQMRNQAGQLQKCRQDRLGMGWANHDHHTFRSSRRYFSQLVHLFEILGFHCRERFYAGAEAGWGAQIMENPSCRLVLFLDVDLSPEEIADDFAHGPLPDLPQLGTIGLWCALHGDSILQAGMHHLEAQFQFDELTQDLAKRGVDMMKPFSSFSYLKQAFTAGEVWPVSENRIQQLLKAEKITQEQANKFSQQGAIGSHLENLQRREGYKGFNQKNVSVIIKKTDPRYL